MGLLSGWTLVKEIWTQILALPHTVQPWVSHSTSLNPSFFLCKIEITL